MFVEKTELFEGLDPELVRKVEQALEQEVVEEGEYVFRRDDPADFLYFLEEGRIRLTVGDMGTVSRTVRTPGDIFGWSSLLGPAAYTASAQCLTRTVVMRIEGQVMREILETNPVTGLVFYRRLAGFIRRRLIDSYRLLLTYDAVKRPHSYG